MGSAYQNLLGILGVLLLVLRVNVAGAVQGDFEGAVLPISADFCEIMKRHHVLNANPPVACNRLSLIKFSYLDFERHTHENGEIVALDAAADHLLAVFSELRRLRLPIAKAKSIHVYDGDDNASMADNNTSAFNHRNIAGSSNISLHAYGGAVDLNPLQNPFVTRGGKVSPPSGNAFLKRFPERSEDALRAGMSEGIIDVFAYHGFVEWGGDWGGPTDYQHFQIPREFAVRLAALPASQAKTLFETHLASYVACRKENGTGSAIRKLCQNKAYSKLK